jgi:hypothetical protein
MSRPELTEEQLRQLEAEMDRITVDDVLVQTVATLLNLAARKAGLAAPPGEGPEPDWEQVREGIDGARALMPLLERRHGDELGRIRETLSQLQLIYAQNAGAAATAPGAPPGAAPGAPAEPAAPGADAPDPAAAEPGSEPPGGASEQGPGPAQRSGRLWVPGQ